MSPPKRIPNSRVLEENELQALVPTEGAQRPMAGVGHGAVTTHGHVSEDQEKHLRRQHSRAPGPHQTLGAQRAVRTEGLIALRRCVCSQHGRPSPSHTHQISLG